MEIPKELKQSRIKHEIDQRRAKRDLIAILLGVAMVLVTLIIDFYVRLLLNMPY